MLVAVRLEAIFRRVLWCTIVVLGVAATKAIETILTVTICLRVDDGARGTTVEVLLETRHLAQCKETLSFDRLLTSAASLALAFAFLASLALATFETPRLAVAALGPPVPITAGVAGVRF